MTFFIIMKCLFFSSSSLYFVCFDFLFLCPFMIFSISACCLNTWRAYQSTMTIFFKKILFVTEIQRGSTQAGEAAIIIWAKQMLNCMNHPSIPALWLSYFPDLLDKFLDSLPVQFFALATTKSTDYLSHYFALFLCHWVCCFVFFL